VSATASAVNPTCYGSSNGAISVTATGGTGSFSYSLNGGAAQISSSFTGLAAGSYIIVVTDINGCSATTNATLVAPPQLQVSATGHAPACVGAASGTIIVVASGGTAPYQYSLNGEAPQLSGTFPNQTPGTDTVVVTDANGCTATTQISLANPVAVSVTVVSTNPKCAASADGTITATATGGSGTFTYSLNGGVAQASNVFTDLAGGTFTLTVTDSNGCTATATATLVNPPALVATATSSQPQCASSNDGSITVTASGGTAPYTYSLNDGAGQSSNVFSNLAGGTYAVTVTDANGCLVSGAVMLSNPSQLSLIAAGTSPTCFGSTNGAVSVTATGGTAPYSYSINGGAAQSSSVFNGLAVGSFTVTVTDANGCTATANATLTSPTQLQVSGTGHAPACTGASSGSLIITATGGTAPYQYSMNGGAYQTSNVFENQSSGTDTVTVQDAHGCTATTQVSLANPVAMTASATVVNPKCWNSHDGSITVSASGGTGTYTYSLNGGAAQASNVFTGLTSGTFSITVTDGNGCTTTTTATIVCPPPLIVSAVANQPKCTASDDGTITVTASGGTAPYTYSLNGGAAQSSNVFSNLGGGTFTVTVTDAHGCTETVTVTLQGPSSVSATASAVNPTCYGSSNGAISVTATGGTAPYMYSINGGAGQISSSFTGLSAGSFAIVVTDAHGCTATTNATLVAPPQLQISGTGHAPACVGSASGAITVIATGGTTPYQYSLNGGAFQSTGTFPNQTPGTDTVTVKDANGCTATTQISLANPVALVVSVVASNPKCAASSDGSITVTASGGTGIFTYSLNSGVAQSSNVFSNLAGGVFTVTVTDSNGCTATATATLVNPPALVATATSSQPQCASSNDGSITVTASGGTAPYTYSLNDGAGQSSNVFSNLAGGTYAVTVTDANGCLVSGAITLSNPSSLSLIAAGMSPTCYGSSNGAVSVTATGGTAPYSYSINGGAAQSSSVFNGLAVGSFTVTVTDANGCTATANATLTNPPQLQVSGTGHAPACTGAASGSVTVVATGGTAPYQYSMNGGAFQSSATFLNQASGTDTITVKDAHGCTATTQVSLANPVALSVTATSVNPKCAASTDGSITVIATGGTGTYTYSLNGGAAQASNVFTGLTAGTFSIIVTDTNGCTANTVVTLLCPPVLTVRVTATQPKCTSSSDGTITVYAAGGTAPYSYSLNGGAAQASNVFRNLASGIYTVTVTDAHGCTVTATGTLSGPSSLTVMASSVNPTCFAGSNGVVSVTASGGTAPYRYALNDGAVQLSSSFRNLGAGSFAVTVTDANGCMATANATLVAPPQLQVTATGYAPACAGAATGSETVVATGGTAPYRYSLNGGPFQASGTFPNQAVGTDTITVKDANGCTASTQVSLAEPLPVTVTATIVNPKCFGSSDGSITVTGTGGTGTFSYSLNGGAAQASNVFSGVGAGTFMVIITDANGCSANTTVALRSPPAVTVHVTATMLTCANSSDGTITATAFGGTAPYMYSLNGGAAQASGVFTGLAAGSFTVSVTDAHNCPAMTTVSVTVPPPIVASVCVMLPKCTQRPCVRMEQPSSQSSSRRGVQLLGAQSKVSASRQTGSNPACCAVTGPDNCTNMCPSGPTVTVFASGGTMPYTYTLNGSVQASNMFCGLAAGTYTIIVTDANGCTTTVTAVVVIPPALSLSATAAVSECAAVRRCRGRWCGGLERATAQQRCPCAGGWCDATVSRKDLSSFEGRDVTVGTGMITAVAVGGTAPYLFSINSEVPQSSNVFRNVASGTYVVTVIDAQMCTTTTTVVVTGPPALSCTATAVAGTCTQSCGKRSLSSSMARWFSSPSTAACQMMANADANVTVVCSGGNPPYQYSLNSGDAQQSQTFSGLLPGSYEVVVTDASSCATSLEVHTTSSCGSTRSEAHDTLRRIAQLKRGNKN
jgi:hypothetical protein